MHKQIDAKAVKELRDLTGAGIMDVKSALLECGGDVLLATEVLRKKGILKAGKKSDRATSQGLIHSYIHDGGRIGVLVEVNCETDFVARNQDFGNLVHDIALHIAASNPIYIGIENVPAEVVAKETAIYKEQARAEGKPVEIAEKIALGRLQKFYDESCLMEQDFVRDTDTKIKNLIKQSIATMGENIQVRRFSRYVLGQ